MIDRNKVDSMEVWQLVLLENALGTLLIVMDNDINREDWRYVSLKLQGIKNKQNDKNRFYGTDTDEENGKIKLW